MSRILLFLAQITKKMRIAPMAYHVLRNTMGRGKAVSSMISWKDYLRELNPDVGGSCLCQNEIVSEGERVNLEIIIPVYNTVKYVAECIESALNQKTKYSYRIIIVNDGSTDGSADIINRYANDAHVRIIHQENRGFSGARNRALEHIGGEYVTFLDSDDRLAEDAVEKLLDKAYKGDYDIVGGGYIRFEGKSVRSRIIPRQGQLYGFPWGKVYKARLWEHFKYPEKYWFEDTVFSMVMHDCAQKMTSIQEIVYDYRINRNSISSSSVGKPKVIDSFWITSKLLDDRETIGLVFDSQFLDQIVHQFKVNTRRIYTLGDKKADFANFQGSKALYFRYFNNCRCQNTANKPIEEAILKDDYQQFLLACLFL